VDNFQKKIKNHPPKKKFNAPKKRSLRLQNLIILLGAFAPPNPRRIFFDELMNEEAKIKRHCRLKLSTKAVNNYVSETGAALTASGIRLDCLKTAQFRHPKPLFFKNRF